MSIVSVADASASLCTWIYSVLPLHVTPSTPCVSAAVVVVSGSLNISTIQIDVVDDAIDRAAVFFDKQFMRRSTGRAPFHAPTRHRGSVTPHSLGHRPVPPSALHPTVVTAISAASASGTPALHSARSTAPSTPGSTSGFQSPGVPGGRRRSLQATAPSLWRGLAANIPLAAVVANASPHVPANAAVLVRLHRRTAEAWRRLRCAVLLACAVRRLRSAALWADWDAMWTFTEVGDLQVPMDMRLRVHVGVGGVDVGVGVDVDVDVDVL